jgi:hypothetical protein
MPEGRRGSENDWLEPHPDLNLQGIADGAPGPDARSEMRESVQLAFVATIQQLPPVNRRRTLRGGGMEALFTGQESVPPQGAQFDVALAGAIKGRVTGTMRGIDYLRVRADGRRELDLRGTVETDDGNRICRHPARQ